MSKFEENYKLTDAISSMKLNHNKHEENYTKHITIKLFKNYKLKENISVRGKKKHTHKEEKGLTIREISY